MHYSDFIAELKTLKHYRTVVCSNCKRPGEYHILDIHGNCQYCGISFKLRGLSTLGTEIEDAIDAVLEWMGEGNNLNVVLSRQKSIQEELKRQHELDNE
jgi:hypothetical protein